MSYDVLVRYCAPTLAGIKVGNLVSYTFENIDDLKKDIESKNRLLNLKGLFFVILKVSNKKALVYVYRKTQLEIVLKNLEHQKFLSENGYDNFELEKCLEILKSHLLNKSFPHEIGVFLGYPLDDIKAFIENKGMNFKLVGCWKSYTNEEKAAKIFAKYKKCTKIYCEKYAEGFEITRLAVAI